VSTASITISHLSTQYVIIPVNAQKSGVSYNPTNDVIQFAFLLNINAYPQLSDWVPGSWDTGSNSLYPYLAECLVGPNGGAINLAIGTYNIFLKVTDNPEIPVFLAGMLIVN
jgi:hypothetical protein